MQVFFTEMLATFHWLLKRMSNENNFLLIFLNNHLLNFLLSKFYTNILQNNFNGTKLSRQ